MATKIDRQTAWKMIARHDGEIAERLLDAIEDMEDGEYDKAIDLAKGMEAFAQSMIEEVKDAVYAPLVGMPNPTMPIGEYTARAVAPNMGKRKRVFDTPKAERIFPESQFPELWKTQKTGRRKGYVTLTREEDGKGDSR